MTADRTRADALRDFFTRSGPALLAAAHPGPTVAVTALSTVFAAMIGRNAAGCALVFATVLTGQLSIGWSNDAIDAGRDAAAHRAGKPVAAGTLSRATVARAAVGALASCVPLSFANGLAAGSAHLVAVGGGWAYNVGLKRGPLSWLPYAVSFALLPAFLVLGLPGAPAPPAWLMAAGGCLGVGAHLFNALPDIEDDQAAGVLSLPVHLGATLTRALGATLLIVAAIVLVIGPEGSPAAVAFAGLAAVAVLALAAATPVWSRTSRVPFLLAVAAAAVDLALLAGQGTTIA